MFRVGLIAFQKDGNGNGGIRTEVDRLDVQDAPFVVVWKFGELQREVLCGNEAVVGHGEIQERAFAIGKFGKFGRAVDGDDGSRHVGLKIRGKDDLIGVGQLDPADLPGVVHRRELEESFEFERFAAADRHDLLCVVVLVGGVFDQVLAFLQVVEVHDAVFVGIRDRDEFLRIGVVDTDFRAGEHRFVGGILGPFIGNGDGDAALVVGDKGVTEVEALCVSVFRGDPDAADVRSVQRQVFAQRGRIDLERDRGAFAVGQVFDDRRRDQREQVGLRHADVDFAGVAISDIGDLEFVVVLAGGIKRPDVLRPAQRQQGGLRIGVEVTAERSGYAFLGLHDEVDLLPSFHEFISAALGLARGGDGIVHVELAVCVQRRGPVRGENEVVGRVDGADRNAGERHSAEVGDLETVVVGNIVFQVPGYCGGLVELHAGDFHVVLSLAETAEIPGIDGIAAGMEIIRADTQGEVAVRIASG